MSIDTPQVTGADRLQRRIATIRRNTNLPALTDEITQLLLRRTQERFEREVTPDGVPWVALTEMTLRRKRQEGYGNKKKLQRTEKMKNVIRIIRGGRGTVYTQATVTTKIGISNSDIAEYAKVQNDGSRRVPARQFLGIGALDVKAVDSLMRRKARALDDKIGGTQ